MCESVLVVSAHPDDEILGAGGTLVRHREVGDKLSWLIATDLFERHGFSPERIASRQNEIAMVANQLSMDTYQLDYPTMTLTSEDLVDLVPKVSEVVNKVKPSKIYLVNRSDAHSDHRVLFDAVMACTKSFRYPFIREVFMYECLSETEFAPPLAEKAFIPHCYVDISEQIDEKLELMRIYESELGSHPFPRSIRNIKALATFRGASCGVEYAEAFQILKSYRFEKL
ncbi:LmbE family N-acetylglucosaminyl deacetylase [Roseivirga pacifica]|jgi:LmbE family N-acetylglucosaminyl deacetylase|uniref:N-acetylglucosaminyl deacetylase, LmbE family n=1 Tax=Roseivirga pacifica TaxID=1267423 RepID=A0A1I0N767_9BACT|nr:PIG-L deacetylase family protein [Roseivirga pacifica]RKQ50951.1 LmbE family N-acetylglucosaminyl deacetylase [Roseivirga pacifica]SEV96518.1 N-acetylglucosaminyl deacetylase, LmbE family [Roseivirga pacifica]